MQKQTIYPHALEMRIKKKFIHLLPYFYELFDIGIQGNLQPLVQENFFIVWWSNYF